MRKDILNKKETILLWIKENKSKAFISKQLGCKQETLNRYLDKFGVQYNGNQSGIGTKKSKDKTYKTLEEYLKYSKNPQTNKIRTRLIEEGIKEPFCECCGRWYWRGKEIPLEVHHIDGNRFNNKISNFQLLCPNCHAQTESYRGKNSRK